jgi:hypothetical protein
MDIEAIRGDTEYYDLAAIRSGAPVSLVGANVKIWFSAKRTSDDVDADAVIKLNSADNPIQIVFTDRPAGLFFIVLTPADTLAIEEEKLVFDVQVREQDGRITTVVRGKLHILPDVTRVVV